MSEIGLQMQCTYASGQHVVSPIPDNLGTEPSNFWSGAAVDIHQGHYMFWAVSLAWLHSVLTKNMSIELKHCHCPLVWGQRELVQRLLILDSAHN